MKLCSLNINGLAGKEGELGYLIRECDPDIIFLQETKTRSTELNDRPRYAGFKEHYCERGDDMKRGGGLCVMWKEDWNLITWDMVVPENMKYIGKERQWYTLVSKNKKYALLNVYMAFESPNNRKWNEDLILLINKEMQSMVMDGYIIIMAGDLNAKIGCNFRGALSKNSPIVDTNGGHILHLSETFNLKIANDEEKEGTLITRRSVDNTGKEWSSSVLDYFITSKDVDIKNFTIMNEGDGILSSDHTMIQMEIVESEEKFKSKRRPLKPRYDLRRVNDRSMQLYGKLSTMKLEQVGMKNFVKLPQHEQILTIEKALKSAASVAFKPKNHKKRKTIKLSRHCEAHIHRRKELWKRMREGTATKEEQKEFRKIKRELRVEYAKEQQHKRKQTAIMLAQEDPTSEKFWNIYRSRKDKDEGIQALKSEDGTIETNPHRLCKVAYEAFKKRLDGSTQPQELHRGEYDNELFGQEMMSPISRSELNKAISSFKNGKAGGPHNMRPEMLKLLSNTGKKYIGAWVNNVFRTGTLDHYLNEGTIKLIYKRGSKLDPLSYRPITLTCILGRLIAR